MQSYARLLLFYFFFPQKIEETKPTARLQQYPPQLTFSAASMKIPSPTHICEYVVNTLAYSTNLNLSFYAGLDSRLQKLFCYLRPITEASLGILTITSQPCTIPRHISTSQAYTFAIVVPKSFLQCGVEHIQYPLYASVAIDISSYSGKLKN